MRSDGFFSVGGRNVEMADLRYKHEPKGFTGTIKFLGYQASFLNT